MYTIQAFRPPPVAAAARSEVPCSPVPTAIPLFSQEPFIELMQNSSPKVDAATLAPATYPEHPDNEW